MTELLHLSVVYCPIVGRGVKLLLPLSAQSTTCFEAWLDVQVCCMLTQAWSLGTRNTGTGADTRSNRESSSSQPTILPPVLAVCLLLLACSTAWLKLPALGWLLCNLLHVQSHPMACYWSR
jgi:hypothetical protein